MSGGTGSERAEVSRLLAEIESRANQTAFGELLHLLIGPAERGIRAAFQSWDLIDAGGALVDPGDTESEAFAAFLTKVQTSRFQAALGEADDPLGLGFQSAKNLALDILKKKPPSTFDEDAPSRPRAEASGDPPGGPDADLNKQQRAHHATTELERALDGLPLDSVILLEVAFAELRELPASHIEHLAARRGVPAAQVRQELANRATHQSEGRDEALSEHERRAHRLASLQREIRRVIATSRERGDPPIDQIEPLSTERAQELRQSSTALRSATPAERAAYLERLYERERTYARKQQEAREKAEAAWPAGKRYDEIVQILGLATDDPVEQRKAVNATTAKLTRLLKRLRQRSSHGS